MKRKRFERIERKWYWEFAKNEVKDGVEVWEEGWCKHEAVMREVGEDEPCFICLQSLLHDRDARWSGDTEAPAKKSQSGEATESGLEKHVLEGVLRGEIFEGLMMESISRSTTIS